MTAIRSRSSSVVTSTVSDRPTPTFAWTTLLVTSSLTSSAASDAALAGIWPSSSERTDLRARAGASSPPGIRMDIDRGEPGDWNADAVMRHPSCEAVAAGTEWSEGHALRPKRVTDDPSFVRSRDPLVDDPQFPRCDRPERLPRAVWLLVQRDLGVQNASWTGEQHDAPEIGVPARGLLRKERTATRLRAATQSASPTPSHNTYRTGGSDRRATSTAPSLLTGAALPLQRPRQPPRGRYRRAIRLLIQDPDAARPAAGTVNVRNSTLLHHARRATKMLREHDQCATTPG